MQRFSILVVAILMIISLSACSSSNNTDNNLTPKESAAVSMIKPSSGFESDTDESEKSTWESSGEVIVELNYEKQSGHASNQFAVWVEDAEGNYINTLYATKYTANGGFKNRPDSIFRWVAKSELALMDKDQVDAITSATPQQGAQCYTWDLTDTNGDPVQYGEYTVFVEGSLRWKNSVLFSGIIDVGDSPNTVKPNAEYTYEAADSQDALTNDSPENSMITDVTVRYIPGGI